MMGGEEESHQDIYKGDKAASPKIIAEYKVAEKDTLSSIALKYYGSAAENLWKYIYETNKAVIGAKPEMLKPGMVLKIPEKPKE
jgi:nucleoid-associated protein YgaU